MSFEKKNRKGSQIEGTSISPAVDMAVPDADRTVEMALPVGLYALKDFEIHHNDYHRVIKRGEDVADVPELYHPNLKTEGVI